MLQALGRETAIVRLIGSWKGTFPVNMRQAHSVLLWVTELSAEQQSLVGEEALPVLPVR